MTTLPCVQYILFNNILSDAKNSVNIKSTDNMNYMDKMQFYFFWKNSYGELLKRKFVHIIIFGIFTPKS